MIGISTIAAALFFIGANADTLTISTTTTLSSSQIFTQPIAVATNGAIIAENVAKVQFEAGLINRGTVKISADGQDTSVAVTNFENHNTFEVETNGNASPPTVNFDGDSWSNEGTISLASDIDGFRLVTVNFSPSIQSIINKGDLTLNKSGYVVLPDMVNDGSINIDGPVYAATNATITGKGNVNLNNVIFLIGKDANLESQLISEFYPTVVIFEPSSSQLNVSFDKNGTLIAYPKSEGYSYDASTGTFIFDYGSFEKRIQAPKNLNSSAFQVVYEKLEAYYPGQTDPSPVLDDIEIYYGYSS